MFNTQEKFIAENLDTDVTLKNWKNWKWQIKHSIRTIEDLESIAGFVFTDAQKEKLAKTMESFPMSINPYYLSLIDRDNFEMDPIYMQAVPSVNELIMDKYDMSDPLAEDRDSPVPHLTHRYPDRVLLHVSNLCSMYCRHCTRKRKVGDNDAIPSFEQLQPALDYIKEHDEVRDVLLSGGDSFMYRTNSSMHFLEQFVQYPMLK